MVRRVTLTIHLRGQRIELESRDSERTKEELHQDIDAIESVLVNYKPPEDVETNVLVKGEIWEEIRGVLATK